MAAELLGELPAAHDRHGHERVGATAHEPAAAEIRRRCRRRVRAHAQHARGAAGGAGAGSGGQRGVGTGGDAGRRNGGGGRHARGSGRGRDGRCDGWRRCGGLDGVQCSRSVVGGGKEEVAVPAERCDRRAVAVDAERRRGGRAALSVPQLDGTGAAPRRCDERPAHRDRTQRAADADGPAIAPAQRHAAHLCRALAARKRTTWREDDRAVPPRVDAVQAEPDIAARRLRARSCIPDRELFSGGSTAAAGRPHKREVRVAARVEHPPVCQRECTRASRRNERPCGRRLLPAQNWAGT